MIQKGLQLLFILCLGFGGSSAFGQNLEQLMDSLKTFRANSIEAETESSALYWNEKVTQQLMRIYHFEESFTQDFSSIPSFGVLTSPDDYFRLFNWNLQTEDGKFLFFAHLLINQRKKASKRVYVLEQKDTIYLDPERESLDQDEWMGALYYEIIPQKAKRGKFYTLLGWCGTDGLTSTKVIETIMFRGKKLRIGLPNIKVNRRAKKRMLFTYNKNVKMGLKYEEKEDRIIYDVLIPKEDRFANYPEFYGPSFTYNTLVWEKGYWVLKKGVQPLAPENKKLKEYLERKKKAEQSKQK